METQSSENMPECPYTILYEARNKDTNKLVRHINSPFCQTKPEYQNYPSRIIKFDKVPLVMAHPNEKELAEDLSHYEILFYFSEGVLDRSESYTDKWGVTHKVKPGPAVEYINPKLTHANRYCIASIWMDSEDKVFGFALGKMIVETPWELTDDIVDRISDPAMRDIAKERQIKFAWRTSFD
jgi:hypothetical protein